MMQKIKITLTAFFLLGTMTALATNPFADVPSDSWSYQSIVELANAGRIPGIDKTVFQSDRIFSRYEMAKYTAFAMAHMDQATVEERAAIGELADEYADELDGLGVRITRLEDEAFERISLSGDARVRYRHGGGRDNDGSWDYRLRVHTRAKVTDRITVSASVSTNNRNFDDNSPSSR